MSLLAVPQAGGSILSDHIGWRMPVLLLMGLISPGAFLAMAAVGEEGALPFVALLAFLLG